MTDNHQSLSPNPNEPVTSLLTDPTKITPAANEFVPDAAKSAEENAAAKLVFDTKAADDKKVAEADAAKKLEEENKTKEQKEAATKANDTKLNPLKFEEIKLPDGFEIDRPIAEKFMGIVNTAGIPRDVVAQLTTLQAEAMKNVSEAGNKSYSDMRDGWKKEVSADADIGGEKLQENLGSISKLVDKYGTPELRLAFDLTGAGDNPHVFRFLTKVAKDLGEGKFVPPGNPASGSKDQATTMFPDQGKT